MSAMEVKLDKQFPLEVSPDQAWAVLRDIRAVAPCMPGAQITEQTDDTHYKGTVKTKIGPASMQFNGTIEVLALDTAARTLQMLGKGADRTGSAASMNLSARIVDGPAAGKSVLEGQAVVTVSGKLAQFGSRLLVPVSDALLAEFANNFGQAAAAVPAAAEAPSVPPDAEVAERAAPAKGAAPLVAPSEPAVPHAPRALGAPHTPPTPETSLNALSLAWTVIKHWVRGWFGRKP
jgi:carbon monoxide dehydrogenase subunit G